MAIPGTSRIFGRGPARTKARAIDLIRRSTTLRRTAAVFLPITSQVRLGILSDASRKAMIKDLLSPVSLDAIMASRSIIRDIASKIFYAPMRGLRAVERAGRKASEFLSFDGVEFGPQLALAGAGLKIREKDLPSSILLFSTDDAQGPKKLTFNGNEGPRKVAKAVFGADNEIALLVVELGEIQGAVKGLEKSGLDLETDPHIQEKLDPGFETYLGGLFTRKQEILARLSELGPYASPADLAKYKELITKKNREVAETKDEIKRVSRERDTLLTLKEETESARNDLQARLDTLLDVFGKSDLGKAKAEIEGLQEELEKATRTVSILEEQLERSAPALKENELLKKDIETILSMLVEGEATQEDVEGIQTELGMQIANIVLPVLKELSELRALREQTLKDLNTQASTVFDAIKQIQSSLAAQIEALEATNLAKNASLKSAKAQMAEMQDELLLLRQRYDSYNELTAIVMDFAGLLKKATLQRLSMPEIKSRAAGLEDIMERISSGSQEDSEAMIPQLLTRMVYRLVELSIKEETVRESAKLTRELLRICRDNGYDLSRIKVVEGEDDVEKGLEEMLGNIDAMFAFDESQPGVDAATAAAAGEVLLHGGEEAPPADPFAAAFDAEQGKGPEEKDPE